VERILDETRVIAQNMSPTLHTAPFH